VPTVEYNLYVATMWAFGAAVVVAAFAGWFLSLVPVSRTTAKKIATLVGGCTLGVAGSAAVIHIAISIIASTVQ